MASSVIDRINDQIMAQVIPGFPNEIALMILRELPLADLVIWYTINNNLRAIMDDEEPLRKKMFRIPKKYDVDETARVAWVRDQWAETYAKMQPNETSPEEFWAHIRVNPLLLIRTQPKKRETVGEGRIYSDTRYFTEKFFYELPRESDLTTFQAVSARRLIDSMFVSYPPVTRVTSWGCHPNRATIIPDPRPFAYEFSTLALAGFKVNKLVALSEAKMPQPYTLMYTKLWPERLWQLSRIARGLPIEEEGREETGEEETSEDSEQEEGSDENEGSDGPDIEEGEDEEHSDDDSGSEYTPEDADDESD